MARHSIYSGLLTGSFPSDLPLDEPFRGQRLLKEFYQQYHEKADPNTTGGQHMPIKAAYFAKWLTRLGHNKESLGLDVGCRFGTLIKLVNVINWVGVDVDPKALEIARSEGIPCEVMDLTFDIGFQDGSFQAVMMTEVLEHLPYPSINVREVHRILKKEPSSVYMGTVPLDYHLHRRWKVLRGKRLSGEQTHVHHFSFNELDHLLKFYFHDVAYLPLAGTAQRHPAWNLPYNLFVRDIAWVASSPKASVGRWGPGKI